jgi:hypothetical protein
MKSDGQVVASTDAEIRIWLEARREEGRYYRSSHWRSISALLRSEVTACEDCGGREELQVHHETYVRIGMEARSDLRVLCDECHVVQPAFGKAPRPGLPGSDDIPF